MKNLDAIIYSRVSTDMQDYNRQIQDIKKYAASNGIRIVEHFEEKESGKIKSRDALTKMLSYCENNVIDAVIISEISRLGRTSEVLSTIEKLSLLEVNLISLKEGIKTLNDDKSINPTSQLIIGVMSSINAHELSTLQYRIVSGLEHAARKGHISGAQIPYGYTSINKLLTINPEQAQVVKDIFDLYISNNGSAKICTILNHNGIKSQNKKRWHDAVIIRMLHNSTYKGVRMYKGLELDAPQIIDAFTFDKVQEMFSNHIMKQGINKKFNHLLNNKKIECGICGKSYFAHKRSNGKDNAYKCISIRYRDNCGNWGVNIDKLTNTLQEILIDTMPQFISKAIDIKPLEENIKKLKDEKLIFDLQLRKLTLNENTLIDLLLEEEVSKDTYKQKRAENEKDKRACVKNINNNTSRIKSLTELLNNSSDIKKNIATWKENGINKDVLNKIITKIVVTKQPDFKEFKTSVKNDKVILIEVYLGTTFLSYYITRYSNVIAIKEIKVPFILAGDGKYEMKA